MSAVVETGLRLNLGCNDRSFKGFIGVDVAPGPGVDQIADLAQERWPWEDSTVEEILAYDVLEHLPNKRHSMNELWRILKPGGIVRIQVPHATDGDGGHCDPTHVSYWTTSDFEYYQKGNYARERFRNSSYYAIKADFMIVGEIKTPRYQRTFGGHVVEIQATLQAVK